MSRNVSTNTDFVYVEAATFRDTIKKKLAASSMLHEAKVAYYAFDVAARFLILLFMPLLWLR